MKLPEPKQLPSGNWFIRLRLGGENIPVTKPTKEECKNTARLIKAEYKAGKRVARCTKTLNTAIDEYIKDSILSPSTIRGYRMIQKHRFQSVIDKPVNSINWKRAIAEESELCSAKTLKNAWGFIRSVLRSCGEEPPSVNLPQVIPKETKFLQPDEIPVFIAAVRGKPCEIPALLALHSLRLSEILALRGCDIQNGVIRVRGAAVKDEHDKLVQKKENKNSSSRRDIPILIDRLNDFNFPNDETLIVNVEANSLRRQINTVCRKAGLPEVNIHGLRHSFASACYFLHIPSKTTMLLGGWSDDGTMNRIYTHLANKELEKDVTALTAFFQNGNGFAL